MKTIPEELKSDIEDAATAGLLGNLPPAVAEKDHQGSSQKTENKAR